MRLSRVIAPAFLVSLCSAAWSAPAAAQPPPEATPAAPIQETPATAPATTPPSATGPLPASDAPKRDTVKGTAIEFTSLKLMLEKGVISQAEYDSAVRDLGESTGMRAGEGNTFVLAKWAATL